ncbi:MAG: transglycosylase SLT domain-containing protein [Bdellovibrionales bacterium]|nr:transglycosylase SLT domain-containing protein [Bdellovibrionales bacterium]
MDPTPNANRFSKTTEQVTQALLSLAGNMQTRKLGELFEHLAVRPSRSIPRTNVVAHSHYLEPLIFSKSRLSGNSRSWGDATPLVQRQVMKEILAQGQLLSTFDKAALVSIARHESGFNPDAASAHSSASGVFQLIDQTAHSLGLEKSQRFNAYDNIAGGILLYKQISSQVPTSLSAADRLIKIYALFHDGPTLKYGGAKIARMKIVPHFQETYRLMKQTRL